MSRSYHKKERGTERKRERGTHVRLKFHEFEGIVKFTKMLIHKKTLPHTVKIKTGWTYKVTNNYRSPQWTKELCKKFCHYKQNEEVQRKKSKN